MSRPGTDFNVARIGLALIAMASAMASLPCEAAARHIKHFKHISHHKARNLEVRNAQASLNGGSELGAMRYYGGPKSPMWRTVQ